MTIHGSTWRILRVAGGTNYVYARRWKPNNALSVCHTFGSAGRDPSESASPLFSERSSSMNHERGISKKGAVGPAPASAKVSAVVGPVAVLRFARISAVIWEIPSYLGTQLDQEIHSSCCTYN